jgi:general stress protein 26
MRQEKVAYEELEQEFENEFKKLGTSGLYERGILATSTGDFVTARKMRFIPDGLKIYCWTNRNTRKHKQILENPNVAIVVGGIQGEGVAAVKGHPMDETEFLRIYEAHLPDAYEREILDWRDWDQIVIEIHPKRLALYKIEDYPDSYIAVLNISQREAHRIYDLQSQKEDSSDAPAYAET